MSNRSTNDLFQLIHSLSRTEKAYFKKYTSLHVMGESNNYVKLFNAIAKQKEYDEKELLQTESYIKQLPVLKNRLYEAILKSLKAYHANSSVDAQLRDYLHDVEILSDKGLYSQCKRIISKAKKLAEQYEKFPQLLDLFKWDVELLQIQSYYGNKEEEIEAYFNEISETIHKSSNVNEYWLVRSRILMKHILHGYIRKPSDTEHYKDIINHPLLKDEKKGLSDKARYLFNSSHSNYLFIHDDIKGAYIYAKKMESLMEANPHYITDAPNQYISGLYFIIIYLLQLKKYEEVHLAIEKIRGINIHSRSIQQRIFLWTSMIEINVYIDSCQFEKGVEWIEKYMKEWEKLNEIFPNSNREMIMYFNNAYLYFITEDMDTSNIWLNKILNETKFDIRSDLYCFAQLLHLIIHYEKYNWELVSYRVVSAERFIRKRKQWYQFEKAILDFFRKILPKINTERDKKETFEKLKTTIVEIIKDPYEKKTMYYFDFISWIDSKIERRSFSEVVREKAAKSTLPYK